MIRKILIILALLAPGVRAADVIPVGMGGDTGESSQHGNFYSPNGFWPTGIFNPRCPGQYEYTLEPGHLWLGCWGVNPANLIYREDNMSFRALTPSDLPLSARGASQ